MTAIGAAYLGMPVSLGQVVSNEMLMRGGHVWCLHKRTVKGCFCQSTDDPYDTFSGHNRPALSSPVELGTAVTGALLS
jgi:hypothetical protein